MRTKVAPHYPILSHLRHTGLTLLEMLVAVAVLAIILTSVGPSIQSILIKNRVNSALNNLSALAQHARFTAVNEQVAVTLCPTENYLACLNDWT